MGENNISLSSRIFYYMMVFIVVESIMIGGVTLYQFNNQNSEYHEGRLERKENHLLVDIKCEIQKTVAKNVRHQGVPSEPSAGFRSQLGVGKEKA